LRVKFGIDPTGSDIHLGHVVPILLLAMFARAGHHIDFVIGDFTARIGDPTARETSRAPISADQVSDNMSSYASQVDKYLDLDRL
jgi:tyrosyl-tRNA synthetase